MRSKQTDDSPVSSPKSSTTPEETTRCSAKEALEAATVAKKAADDARQISVEFNQISDRTIKALDDKMRSPWKGWSFLYRLMFILGVVLIMALSFLFPVITVQQVNTNNKQIDINTQLLDQLNSNHSETLNGINTIVKYEKELQANNQYRLQIQINICKATPGCVIPTPPNGVVP